CAELIEMLLCRLFRKSLKSTDWALSRSSLVALKTACGTLLTFWPAKEPGVMPMTIISSGSAACAAGKPACTSKVLTVLMATARFDILNNAFLPDKMTIRRNAAAPQAQSLCNNWQC